MAKRIQPEQFYSMESGFEYYLTTSNYEEFQRMNRTTLGDDDKEYNYQMAVFYFFRRNWKKADSLYTVSSHPEDIDAGLVKIHLGNKEQGGRFLQKAIDHRKRFETFNNSGTTYDISRAYAALQDSRYVEYFNKALQKGWHNYSFFESDPFFDFVKDKPEFKKLKQQLDERNEQFKAAMYAGMKKFYEEDRD